MVVRSIAIKTSKKYVLIKKRHIKYEKYITPKDFPEYITKSEVSENSKVFMVNSYEMDFMKRIVILVKIDDTYNILKVIVYWSRNETELDDQSFYWSLPLCVHTYASPLLRDRLHLVRDTAAEKEVDIGI